MKGSSLFERCHSMISRIFTLRLGRRVNILKILVSWQCRAVPRSVPRGSGGGGGGGQSCESAYACNPTIGRSLINESRFCAQSPCEGEQAACQAIGNPSEATSHLAPRAWHLAHRTSPIHCRLRLPKGIFHRDSTRSPLPKTTQLTT
jgi:hypothetical protein